MLLAPVGGKGWNLLLDPVILAEGLPVSAVFLVPVIRFIIVALRKSSGLARQFDDVRQNGNK